jgi:transcriptional regulator with XRE-family HTH domain
MYNKLLYAYLRKEIAFGGKHMVMSFGEAMSMLLKKKGLSATTTAQDLGFKSRTAFFRILHDESRMPSIKKCFEAAKESALLALTDEEVGRSFRRILDALKATNGVEVRES